MSYLMRTLPTATASQFPTHPPAYVVESPLSPLQSPLLLSDADHYQTALEILARAEKSRRHHSSPNSAAAAPTAPHTAPIHRSDVILDRQRQKLEQQRLASEAQAEEAHRKEVKARIKQLNRDRRLILRQKFAIAEKLERIKCRCLAEMQIDEDDPEDDALSAIALRRVRSSVLSQQQQQQQQQHQHQHHSDEHQNSDSPSPSAAERLPVNDIDFYSRLSRQDLQAMEECLALMHLERQAELEVLSAPGSASSISDSDAVRKIHQDLVNKEYSNAVQKEKERVVVQKRADFDHKAKEIEELRRSTGLDQQTVEALLRLVPVDYSPDARLIRDELQQRAAQGDKESKTELLDLRRAELQQSIEELTASIQAMESSSKSLTKTIHANRGKLKKVRDENSKYDRELELLEHELALIENGEARDLQQSETIRALESERSELQVSKSQLASVVASLQAEVLDLDQGMQSLAAAHAARVVAGLGQDAIPKLEKRRVSLEQEADGELAPQVQKEAAALEQRRALHAAAQAARAEQKRRCAEDLQRIGKLHVRLLDELAMRQQQLASEMSLLLPSLTRLGTAAGGYSSSRLMELQAVSNALEDQLEDLAKKVAEMRMLRGQKGVKLSRRDDANSVARELDMARNRLMRDALGLSVSQIADGEAIAQLERAQEETTFHSQDAAAIQEFLDLLDRKSRPAFISPL